MRINFDKESLKLSQRKVVTGIISVNYGKYFPEKEWNDSLVIILESWKKELNLIKANSNYIGQFYFFDGPFYFTLTKKSYKFYGDFFQNEQLKYTLDVDFGEFSSEVDRVAHEILNIAKERQWSTPELNDLSKLL